MSPVNLDPPDGCVAATSVCIWVVLLVFDEREDNVILQWIKLHPVFRIVGFLLVAADAA